MQKISLHDKLKTQPTDRSKPNRRISKSTAAKEKKGGLVAFRHKVQIVVAESVITPLLINKFVQVGTLSNRLLSLSATTLSTSSREKG